MNFNFYRTPQIIFGAGKFRALPDIIAQRGKKILIITGSRSLQNSTLFHAFLNEISRLSIQHFQIEISGEPSPGQVDKTVQQYAGKNISAVVSIGGGSVIDAGKAISAMLPSGESVVDYLEGIGKKKHDGRKVPFIAVPTTSGTGSEASANAVLSHVGANGYKRSIRHDNFCPDIALVDSELTLSCPSTITGACGMDALTQLIESYVSDKSSPFTDALVESALPLVKNCLVEAFVNGNSIQARTGMAYASLVSGITLANAGLGVVHGFASSIGSLFPIPHGIVCGTLLASSTHMTIQALESVHTESALVKYARIGELLTGTTYASSMQGYTILLNLLDQWTSELNIPKLSHYGITQFDIDGIIKETGNKNNPARLDNAMLKSILKSRI